MGENKQLICDLLCKTLQATRYGDNIKRIVYKPERYIETAEVCFSGKNVLKVNVTLDSGIAMIRDILKGLSDL